MQKIQNLSDLVGFLRRETVDKTIEESLKILQNITGKYHINVRAEMIRDNAAPMTCRADVNTLGHCVDEIDNYDIRRILLTSNRLKADFSNELVRQCNGVVLEYPSWNFCAIPAKMFNPKFRHDHITANLDDYQIFDIKDGTTVTLYWYGSDETAKWCLSSTNGYEVNNYRWMGHSTYHSALCEVAAQYPNFSFDHLDKNKSYTIGFHHESFQPLLADVRRLWFIQSCDIGAANESYIIRLEESENIGIPIQKINTSLIRGQDIMYDIYNKNSTALTRFIDTLNSESTEIHYGFILRSISGNTFDVIFESELLKTIRKMVYDLPKRKFTNAVSITPENRLKYITLRSYLSHKSRYLFIDLFPQFTNYYKRYDIKFNMLSNKVMRLLRDKNISASRLNTSAKRIDILAIELAKYIESRDHINVMNEHGPNIVLDFLTDVRNLDLYFPCFTDE